MTTNYLFKFSILIIFYFFSIESQSQTTYDWLNTAPDGNWRQGAAAARWNPGGLFDEPPPSNILQFNNNHQLNMTNNVDGQYNLFGIQFGSSNTLTRTINNGLLGFFDFSGVNPRIRNDSNTNHIINSPIVVGTGGLWNFDIIANSGSLTLNGSLTHNSGKILFLQGNNAGVSTLRSLNFNGVISGNGTVNIIADAFVRYNFAHTYSGPTNIIKGELAMGENGDITLSAINLGIGSEPSNTAKFFLDNSNGGQDFIRDITVNNGNTNTRYIGSLNISGVNILSGDVIRASNEPLNIEVVAGGGTMQISGNINGSGTVTKVGLGTVIFTSNKIYSGTTVISAGTLNLQGDLTNSDVTVQSGATLEIDGDVTVKSLTVNAGASVNVTEGKSLTITGNLNNSGSFNLNSTSITYSSLIVNGTSTGAITYNRWVNANFPANGPASNDLASAPTGIADVATFLSNNSNLLSQTGTPTIYAFAPFNNNTGNYENFDSNDTGALISGTGYRAATVSGATLAFTGTVATGNVNVGITSETGTFGKWNLIGNPYPSYLDFASFFDSNKTEFNTGAFQAIYGYNATASRWTIWNQATIDDLDITELIAPGQGFFVNSKDLGGSVSFEPAMRATGSSDDFIMGRSASNVSVARADINLLKGTNTFSTIIYFNSNATRNLDPGYDAGAYTGNANGIFTHLVEGNTGVELAMQVLGYEDFNDVIIPLGIKSISGENLSISLDQTTNTLPGSVNVYLEDVVNGTFTLLNTNTFQLTPSSDLNGTGRFFLRFTNGTLSIDDVTESSLNIYYDQAAQSIVIAGQLSNNSTANLYDLQGRLVNSLALSASQTQHSLDVSALQTGIYIVNIDQLMSRKVNIK